MHNKIDLDRLQHIRERIEVATQGKWYRNERGTPANLIKSEAGDSIALVSGVNQEGNMQFIEHSKDDMEYLLSLIDQLCESL